MTDALQHGQGGWRLVDYEWFPESGESVAVYERHDSGQLVTREIWRTQPRWWLPLEKRELD